MTMSRIVAENPAMGHHDRTPRSQALAAYLAEGGTASVVKLDRSAHRERQALLFAEEKAPPSRARETVAERVRRRAGR